MRCAGREGARTDARGDVETVAHAGGQGQPGSAGSSRGWSSFVGDGAGHEITLLFQLTKCGVPAALAELLAAEKPAKVGVRVEASDATKVSTCTRRRSGRVVGD